MNCLEFRRQHDIDPHSVDDAFNAHMRSCEACAQFARRARGFEHKLAAALRLPIPENLTSRVLMKQSFEPSSAPRRWLVRTLAASLVLAVGVVTGISLGQRPPPLGQELARIIAEEAYALEPTAPISLSRIQLALNPLGISMEHEVGTVTFASPCVVRGKLAGHLVIRGEKAPITVMVMPREPLDARLMVGESNAVGVIVPSGAGSIAILGAPGERLDGIEKLVRRSIRLMV